MSAHAVALVPGDGIGPELVAEARRVLDATGVDVAYESFDWGASRYRATGRVAPDNAVFELCEFDAILLGAICDRAVPREESLWGLLLPLRQELDLWVNVRPSRLLPGIPSPLASPSAQLFDVLFLRENTEGEYAGVGGLVHSGRPGEVALESSVFTRSVVERLFQHAFREARRRKGAVTSATKSNASRFGYALWDRVAAVVAEDHPDVGFESVLVDALAARIVDRPESLDVVVASNLFGGILGDLAGALQGGLGMAASASLAPDRSGPGLFEPVRSAEPELAGRGVANPCGAIWSAAMLLEHLGEPAAAAAVMAGLSEVCAQGPRTPDVGGDAHTAAVGDAVAHRVARLVSGPSVGGVGVGR